MSAIILRNVLGVFMCTRRGSRCLPSGARMATRHVANCRLAVAIWQSRDGATGLAEARVQG
jgi:hypothetical protein